MLEQLPLLGLDESMEMIHIGNTQNLVKEEIKTMLKDVQLIKKSRGKKAINKKVLSAKLRRYRPGFVVELTDDWAKLYDEDKEPVTRQQVKDDILWELSYWGVLSQQEFNFLSGIQ